MRKGEKRGKYGEEIIRGRDGVEVGGLQIACSGFSP